MKSRDNIYIANTVTISEFLAETVGIVPSQMLGYFACNPPFFCKLPFHFPLVPQGRFATLCLSISAHAIQQSNSLSFLPIFCYNQWQTQDAHYKLCRSYGVNGEIDHVLQRKMAISPAYRYEPALFVNND